MRFIIALIAIGMSGCATVEPGHLGLMFKSLGGGLQRDQLSPGLYFTGAFSRVEDFDVTYSTHHEEIETTSTEGLHLNLKLSVIYRPVASELYNLDSEIGLNYYDEVIGPEFRSAARGVFAHHGYQELLKKNESIEDEIETDLRRRITGKHVEISSITLEAIDYAPEISKAVQDKLASEQDALRQKVLAENEDARRRMQLKNEAEQREMQQKNDAEARALQLKNDSEQSRMKDEAALRKMKQDVELAKQQAQLDKIREESEATTQLIKARSEADQAKFLAIAKAAENKAANQSLTPLAVMMHGYDALEKLGGTETHIYLGDWSKMPNFLFPPNFQTQAQGKGGAAAPAEGP